MPASPCRSDVPAAMRYEPQMRIEVVLPDVSFLLACLLCVAFLWFALLCWPACLLARDLGAVVSPSGTETEISLQVFGTYVRIHGSQLGSTRQTAWSEIAATTFRISDDRLRPQHNSPPSVPLLLGCEAFGKLSSKPSLPARRGTPLVRVRGQRETCAMIPVPSARAPLSLSPSSLQRKPPIGLPAGSRMRQLRTYPVAGKSCCFKQQTSNRHHLSSIFLPSAHHAPCVRPFPAVALLP